MYFASSYLDLNRDIWPSGIPEIVEHAKRKSGLSFVKDTRTIAEMLEDETKYFSYNRWTESSSVSGLYTAENVRICPSEKYPGKFIVRSSSFLRPFDNQLDKKIKKIESELSDTGYFSQSKLSVEMIEGLRPIRVFGTKASMIAFNNLIFNSGSEIAAIFENNEIDSTMKMPPGLDGKLVVAITGANEMEPKNDLEFSDPILITLPMKGSRASTLKNTVRQIDKAFAKILAEYPTFIGCNPDTDTWSNQQKHVIGTFDRNFSTIGGLENSNGQEEQVSRLMDDLNPNGPSGNMNFLPQGSVSVTAKAEMEHQKSESFKNNLFTFIRNSLLEIGVEESLLPLPLAVESKREKIEVDMVKSDQPIELDFLKKDEKVEEPSKQELQAPRSTKQVNSLIQGILRSAETLSQLDLSNIDKSIHDEKKISTLEKQVIKAKDDLSKKSKENSESLAQLKKKNTQISSLTAQIDSLKDIHQEEIRELNSKIENSEDKQIVEDLRKQIDQLNKENAKVTKMMRQAFETLALGVGEDVSAYIIAAEEAKEEVEEANELTSLVEDENDELRERITHLQSQITRLQSQTLGSKDSEPEPDDFPRQLPQKIKSNVDMLKYADEHLSHIFIGPDAFEKAAYLDKFEKSSSWAKKAFNALIGMNDYAISVESGEVDMNLPNFLSNGHTKNGVSSNKIAIEGSNKSFAPDYRKSRTFRAPSQWSRPEEECYSHIRIDQLVPAPRIHFYDATREEVSGFMIGYYGEHLPNRIATSVS